MKYVRLTGIIATIVFVTCVIFFIIYPFAEIAVAGVFAGLVMSLCLLYFFIEHEKADNWWNEVEDIDQQKIYHDENN